MAHAPALPGGSPQTVEGWDWEKRMEKLSWWSLGPLGPSVCSLVTPSSTSWNCGGGENVYLEFTATQGHTPKNQPEATARRRPCPSLRVEPSGQKECPKQIPEAPAGWPGSGCDVLTGCESCPLENSPCAREPTAGREGLAAGV